MKTVNWGIIGCGDVTEVKSGPGLYKAEHSRLLAVYNRTGERARDYARRHGVDRVYESAEELLADGEIDVVYIATPPNSHRDYALMTLKAGKIPYIEKPLTPSYEEAREIQSLSKELGIPVYVAFYRRGLEKFLKIKELLDRGTIGPIRYINITHTEPVKPVETDKKTQPWRVKPEISGGGKFLDMAVHVLDCLALFFGEFESMEGHVQNLGGYYGADDTISAVFRFKSGLCGAGNWCFVADKQENEVQIIGEKGRIVYDGMSVKEFRLILDGKEKTYQFEKPEHIAMPYEQALVYEILGQKKSHADFDQALSLTKVMSSLLAVYYKP
ncbi:MAG: Gfo/Idh/MocA family oxidoreductase [Spirochaetales bacterium]|nr:Gfo/Idh/MocA family oxidoreductase [Spirochaetales bacterium]